MPTLPKQQLRLIAFLFVGSVAILALAWFAFFRTSYVPAYQNLRQSDASAIVRELDKAGISYRLENEGRDVLVPEEQSAEARVVVAGSNVALGGTVGFELFNDSDMGLTEFAQKINFQRAMQGELARTIMMSEGVEFARVHLALPERSIFRSVQGEPTAAVTVQMVAGQTLTEQRISGIRQLVASSVPGLAPAAVAVLNQRGDLMTPAAAPADNNFGAPLDERAALDRFYQARGVEAVAGLLSGRRYEIFVNTRRIATKAPALSASEPGATTPEPVAGQARATPERDAVALMVQVRTTEALPAELQSRVEAALTDRLELSRDRGDSLQFITGAIWEGSPAEPAKSASPAEAPAASAPVSDSLLLGPLVWWIVGGILAVAALAWLLLRSRRKLDDSEAVSFAEHLRKAAMEGRANAS